MQKTDTVHDYINELVDTKRFTIQRMRDVILAHLPPGFEEVMSYGMIGYVVPHSLYPKGYHCDPTKPLPFMAVAAQKNSYSFYHMGMYANPELLKWFTDAYPSFSKVKLDMGKSCIRFKQEAHIPFELLGKLVAAMSVQDWISLYEKEVKR